LSLDNPRASFIDLVRLEGARRYRELPWRNIDDPFTVLTSEVMLQQTQVARVLGHWERWMAAFPTPDALAAASTADVLERWQGLGYHRRALALKRAAELCSERYAGQLPRDYKGLLELPGVGPATAAGVCVFAWQQPQVYLETNVRTVFLHHFFEGRDQVPDSEIIPLIQDTCDTNDPRGWYYALLDYGSYLKSTVPNPSRRSRHHTRQSAFEGSKRQKRAELLRLVLAEPGCDAEELAVRLAAVERAAGREATDAGEVAAILATLEQEGFLTSYFAAGTDSTSTVWHIAN
jgi:A/G-specific adenine glycosylase